MLSHLSSERKWESENKWWLRKNFIPIKGIFFRKLKHRSFSDWNFGLVLKVQEK